MQFRVIHHHHHHHIVLAARISLTLSRHSSLSFIALGRSSGHRPLLFLWDGGFTSLQRIQSTYFKPYWLSGWSLVFHDIIKLYIWHKVEWKRVINEYRYHYSRLMVRYTHSLSYIYIYIYIIKQYRHPLSTHFCIYPFESLHQCYRILQELAYKTPKINWFPSVFCPILGYHQGCVYCKIDVNFTCILLLCQS